MDEYCNGCIKIHSVKFNHKYRSYTCLKRLKFLGLSNDGIIERPVWCKNKVEGKKYDK